MAPSRASTAAATAQLPPSSPNTTIKDEQTAVDANCSAGFEPRGSSAIAKGSKNEKSAANFVTISPNNSADIPTIDSQKVEYLVNCEDGESRFLQYCIQHRDAFISTVCKSCELMMCEFCFEQHACSNEGFCESLSLMEYAINVREKHNRICMALQNSFLHDGATNTDNTAESKTIPIADIKLNDDLPTDLLSEYQPLVDHINCTVNSLLMQVIAFRDHHLSGLYKKMYGLADLNNKDQLVLAECFKCIDDYLNSNATTATITELSANTNSYPNDIINRDKSCQKRPQFTDFDSSASNNTTTSNGSNSYIRNSVTQTINLIDALKKIKGSNLLVDLEKQENKKKLSVTRECRDFEIKFKQEVSRFVSSQSILHMKTGNTPSSTGNSPMVEMVSPSSILKKFPVIDGNIDMSVNEYANTSFGHIVQPPGMSPSFTHLLAPTSLQSSFQTLHNSSFPNVSFEFLNFQNPINMTEYGLSQVNVPSVPQNCLPKNPNNHNIMHNVGHFPNNSDCNSQSSNQMIESFKANPSEHKPPSISDCKSDSKENVNSNSLLVHRKTLMQIKRKFGDLGSSVGQFNSPHGFCLDQHGNILIADTNNHRILFFSKDGELIHHFGTTGRADGQLWYPRKIAVMRNDQFVVCDRGNDRSRMQIFNYKGEFIRQVAIRFIDIVASIAINESNDQCQIIVVDSVSPTVYVISEHGEIIRWFDCSDYMKEPSDLAVYNNLLFICDFKGHSVVVFTIEGTFRAKFGGENITNFPNGIDILDNGNILVGDSHGNRFHVVVYNQEFMQINEFECPFVKVSRCCGLKVMPDGCIVTLAKNNHHVLILNQIINTISGRQLPYDMPALRNMESKLQISAAPSQSSSSSASSASNILKHANIQDLQNAINGSRPDASSVKFLSGSDVRAKLAYDIGKCNAGTS
ncbi:MAG: hypothetical protein MHMPM18_000069 [Marteilia pararefringens]